MRNALSIALGTSSETSEPESMIAAGQNFAGASHDFDTRTMDSGFLASLGPGMTERQLHSLTSTKCPATAAAAAIAGETRWVRPL